MNLLTRETQLIGKTISFLEITEDGDEVVIGTDDGFIAVIDIVNEDGALVFNQEKVASLLTYYGHLDEYSKINHLIEAKCLQKREGFAIIETEKQRIINAEMQRNTRSEHARRQQYLKLKEEFEGEV